tara:strand:- start:6703 stop:6849 length:147 start_codon:yes stop_codon:yes gene_type:complete
MSGANDNPPRATVVRFLCTGCGVLVFAVREAGRRVQRLCTGRACGAPV